MHSQPRHGFQSRAWLGIPRRFVSAAAAFLMVAALATVGGAAVNGTASAAPPATLTVTKEADARVLVGEPITYTITAQNSGTDVQGDRVYNLSFRDQLLPGLTYKSGSSRQGGAALKDPNIVSIDPDTVPSSGDEYQVLIWPNTSDLPGQSEQSITFQAVPDPSVLPVGSTVANSASAYANSDARYVPKFDAFGDATSGPTSYTASGTSDTATTQITAIKIVKTEDSPEHELMRGAHKQHGIYTLTVTNNGYAATNDIEVVDYLPAGLEFLQCGGIDNGAAATYEYGARRLTENVPAASPCENPFSVETVAVTANTIAAPSGGYLAAGVYTEVTWKPAGLAASGTWTTQYVAAIPQRENELFADPAPSATCSDVSGTWTCPQAANLDNNTGQSTREQDSTAGTQSGETGLTNFAEASGAYQGSFASGSQNRVSDSDSLTVTAEDIAIQKSVSPGAFKQGDIATYTLNVEVSEYVDATGIVVTDVLPDGLCPVDSLGACTTVPANAQGVSGGTIQNIQANAPSTGQYTITFAGFDLPSNGIIAITYDALMRDDYTDHDGAPTVSGDDYTNHVSLIGTTTTRNDVNAPPSDTGVNAVLAEVRDASEASITSDAPKLKKTIQPNTVAGAYTCDATPPSAYKDNDTTHGGYDPEDGNLSFHIGDRVCFDIRVDFSDANFTKNAVLTDFLPPFVEYEAATEDTSSSDVTAVLDATRAATANGGMLTWTIGDAVGGDKFVDKTKHVFEWQVSAIVTMLPSDTDQPDVKGNLAKLTWTNTDDAVSFIRDEVNFNVIDPTPSLAKTHTPAGPFVGGDTVDYTITATNNDITAITVVKVADELPTGIACADISAISAGGGCSGSGPSVIAWTIASIPAAGHKDLTYTMTIPGNPGVLTAYKNYTGVVSYASELNHNPGDTGKGTADHHPANGRPTLKDCGSNPLPGCDPLPIQADDTVNIKNTALTKDQTTAIDGVNNTQAAQAVIGEEITYTVKATVPAHTTVYQGTVSDMMPTGIELLSATAKLDSGSNLTDGANSAVGGASNTVNWSANDNATAGADSVTLGLGATYANSTAVDQVFTITITARATTLVGNTHNTSRVNTATFVRKNQASGGSNLPAQSASKTTTIVEPRPTITKADNSSGKVTAGQDVQYTLTIGNTTGRPTLYDIMVVDCLPAGLTLKTFDDPSTDAASEAGTGSNGCAAGTTKLTWTNLPDLVAGAAATAIKYTATVSPAAAGGASYKNDAAVHGNDLTGDTKTDGTADIGRIYTATTDHTVSIDGAGIVKSVNPTNAAVGDTVTYTVSVTLPKNVNFYDAVVHDTLPAAATLGAATNDTCTLAGVDCSGTALRQTASGHIVGWSLGDIPSALVDRTLVITYQATLIDTSAGGVTSPVASDSFVNSAYFGWNPADDSTPADPGTDPTQKTTDATATATVTEPSLTIVKKVNGKDSDTAEVNGTFTYTVVVSNASGATVSAAHHVKVVDTIPAGVIASLPDSGGVTAGQDATTGGGGTITWDDLGPIAPGSSVTLSYTGAFIGSANLPSSAQENVAKVTDYYSVDDKTAARHYQPGTGSEPELTADADVTPLFPHFTAAKTASDDPTYIGDEYLWTFTVKNDGAAKGFKVGATDALPPNWTYVASSAEFKVDGGAFAALLDSQLSDTVSGSVHTLVWSNITDLDKDSVLTVRYKAKPGPGVVTSPGVGHTVDHTNKVTPNGEDATGVTGHSDGAGGTTSYSGPQVSASTHIDSADVKIVKSVEETPAAGLTGKWKLVVTNDGPDTAVPDAGGFVVDDSTAPPTGFVLTGADGGPTWTCDAIDAGHQTVHCVRTTPTDQLANGISFPAITVTYSVAADVPLNTTYPNTATVSGSKTYDPNDPSHGTNNNTSSATATVGATADLGISKTLDGDHMVAGENASYSIVVHNYGPAYSQSPITVSDDIPNGTTFVSASGTGWTCTNPALGASTGTISCVQSALANGADTAALTVVVKVDSGRITDVVNTATVTATTNEGTNTNSNSDGVTKTPEQSADIAVVKAVGTAPVRGRSGSWVLTVTNKGPSDASSVHLSDDLSMQADGVTPVPAGIGNLALIYDNTVWSPCAIDSVTLKLDCDYVGTMKAGATTTVTVTYDVASTVAAGTVWENKAEVHSTTPDPNDPYHGTNNNEDTESTTVRNPPPPPVVTTPVTTTPVTTPTAPVTTTTSVPPTTPTIPTVVPSSATSPSSPPPPTNVPGITTNVPEPNQCVDLMEHGFDPGETVTITVTGPDGQYTITAVADENGDVAFCLQSAVPVRVVIEVLGEHHVVVREVVLGIGGELPNTGVPTVEYVTFALLLLGAGIALMLVSRRGRRGRHVAG